MPVEKTEPDKIIQHRCNIRFERNLRLTIQVPVGTLEPKAIYQIKYQMAG